MKIATFYIGLNDKDSKRQEIGTIEAGKIIKRILCGIFEGATISEADGIFTHANGATVIEKTIRAEVFDPADSKIKQAAEQLKSILNQEAIAVKVENVEINFL